MSKTKQAEDMFRADPSLSAKEVAEKLDMHISHAYNTRRKIVGAVFKKNRKTQRTMKVVSINQEPTQEPTQEPKISDAQRAQNLSNMLLKESQTVSHLNNSNILLEAQLNEALRELEDCRAVIRYLEKKINADAV